MENYKDSISFKLELKNLLLQLTDVYKVSASPHLEKVEELTKQAVNEKKDFLVIVNELFAMDEKNELVEVVLLNFVLKVLRDFFEQIPQNDPNLISIISQTVGMLREAYSDPYFTSKMLEFLRLYFGLPLEYITLENCQTLWKIVKRYLRIQEDYMAQMNHDMILKCIKAFFCTVRSRQTQALSADFHQIVLFIFEELRKEISELIVLCKKENNLSLRKEYLKSLENLCSSILFCLEILVDQDLKFLNDFLLHDFMYDLIQLVDIEDSSILSLTLSFNTLFWKFKNNNTVDVKSLISTLFNQFIMRPLQKFSSKYLSNLVKERDIFNLHHLMSYLIQFLQNKEYVTFIYINNDLTSLKKQLFDEILENIFRIVEKAAENSSQSNAREIFDIVLEFVHGSLEIDESRSIHLEAITIEDKDKFNKLLRDTKKWEEYAILANENPKEFIKKISDEYIDEESLEKKAEKIAYFLHLSHHIQSGKIIEILGLDKPLNREILKQYIGALDFRNLDVLKAMRLMFINFLMFGEAQVVERVLGEFCKQYYNANSSGETFASSGAVHTFTYAIIMLNTDLYKPILKEKMSIEAFVNNCRRINDGNDLPEDFLRGCYKSLQQYEMKTLASRDLSQEENVLKESWKNYLTTIQMYDNQRSKIYARNDKFINPREIKDVNTLIDYHSHKKVITKIIENLDLFLTKSYLDANTIDLFFDKIVRVCAHYEMFENLDRLMVSMVKKVDAQAKLELVKMNDTLLWNLFCAFLYLKKSLVYLDSSMNMAGKLLVNTFHIRKYLADDKIAIMYLNRYKRIKQSSRFVNKAIYKNSSFFEAFLGFVSKEENSSEEENEATTLQKAEYQTRGIIEKISMYKKYYSEYNVFDEIYDQTKFLTDEHITRLFDVLINDSELIEGIQKDPSLLVSLNSTLYEIAARNYDRPKISWNAIAPTFIHISLLDSKSKAGNDAGQKDKLDKLFKFKHSKLEGVFESLLQKKSRRSTTIQLFVHYSLFELCLKFCHHSKDLPGFEEFLSYTLDCITEYSVPILVEFIRMIQEVINSYQFTESQNLTHWAYLIRILRKLFEALTKNNLGVGEVQEACVKYSELLNDSILKLSFLTDNDFTVALQELTDLLKEFQAADITKQFQLFSTVINNFYMLIIGIEKRNANEYLKNTPDLIMTIFDIATTFVLTANPAELNIAFKLLQKVLYLLQSENVNDEKIKHILQKFNDIKKRLMTQNDENLCLSYLETLRKFLLGHIENVQTDIQEDMMLTFFEQLFEFFDSFKKFLTLHEIIFEYLNSTYTIFVNLNILGENAVGNTESAKLKSIYTIISKFPKDRVDINAPVQEAPLLPETLDLKSPPKTLSNKSSFKEETPKNGVLTPKEVKSPKESKEVKEEEISKDELVKKQPVKI